MTVMQKIVESINNNAQQATQSPEHSGDGGVEAGFALPTSGADLQVYGVAKADITDGDVVDVADALMNEDAESRPKDFVVVVDATLPGANGPESAPQEHVEYLSEAMEALTKRLGGRFYHSFEEFVEATVSGEKNEGADGTGGVGDAASQGIGGGDAGDPAVDKDPLDPSLTARVVEIAKMAREEAAAEAPAGEDTGIAPALENGTSDGNSDTGQPVVQPVQALPNDPGAMSPEAQAAIGAGDDKVPAPKKEGEVEANIANGDDPTVSIAGGAALESFRVKIVTLAPAQRVRARK